MFSEHRQLSAMYSLNLKLYSILYLKTPLSCLVFLNLLTHLTLREDASKNMCQKIADESYLHHVHLDTLKKQHDSRTINIDIFTAITQSTSLIGIYILLGSCASPA